MSQSINQRYQLLEKLGQGGMGVVYKVQDQLSGDVIALKQVIVSPYDLQFASTSDDASESASALANFAHWPACHRAL